MISIYLTGFDNWYYRDKFARLLLDNNADPNLCDSFGLTPLIHAAINGQTDYVKVLLSYERTNYELCDKAGNNALMLASRYGQVQVLRLLAEHICFDEKQTTDFVDHRNYDNKTALDMASEGDHFECISLLETLKQKLNQREEEKSGPEVIANNLRSPSPTSTARSDSTSQSQSREAFFAQKSASFDLVDACTQANLSCDVITYDSDDEMVKTRRGIPFGGLRNKKGHPIYSREDIREQYCITRKELDVLEHSWRDSSAARLFGCLSTSHIPDSHCNKSSFLLLSCVQRRKNSSDFDEESDPGPKQAINPELESIKKVVDDEDSSDGGFKQRVSSIQPITRTVKRIEFIENNVSDRQQQSSYSRQSSLCYQKSRFDKTCSSFDDSYDHSFDSQMDSPLKRPSKLYFIDNMETSQLNTTTSHSVDELNDRQTVDCLSWKDSRMAKTPEINDENRLNIKKRVTFAATHLVRSATVGGINTIHPSTPTQPISERLVNESIQVNGSLLMKKTDSIDSFDQKSIQSSRMSDFLPAYRAALRRTSMKTQATQTDTSLRRSSNRSIRRSIPAYLTLSPRSSKPDAEHRIYAHSYDSDDEEDVLQISVKEKRLRKYPKTRSIDETKGRTRRKARTAPKTSPKRLMQSIDIQTDLNEMGFHKLDSSSDQLIDRQDLISKSSSDSNQLKSESELISSASNDLDSSYRSVQSSQDSTTIISELNDSLISSEDKQRLIDETIDDFVGTTDVTKRPLIIDPKKVVTKTSESSFTSPDSDNYSFPPQQKPCAPSEISAHDSTSPPVDNIDSGSSVYVSANETSPQVDKDKNSGQTSFETASNGSRFSSPPSTDLNRTSPPERELKASTALEDIKSIQTTIPVKYMEELSNESNSETIDAIELREQTFSPESIASTHNSTEHNIEDFDSEDIGDITPIQDLSTDTSTAIETSTVVENTVKSVLKPKIPPKPTFLLGNQTIDLTEKLKQSAVIKVEEVVTNEEEDQQSDDDIIDDVSGGDFIVRRNMSGELSTVSEVSEEISANGKSQKSDSGSGIHMTQRNINEGIDANQVSSSDTGGFRSNSPSIAESTTSGSFMIDCNMTEPNSLSETTEKPQIEKSGSFPTILSESVVKTSPIESIDSKEELSENKSEPTGVVPSNGAVDDSKEDISVESNGKPLEVNQRDKIQTEFSEKEVESENKTFSIESGKPLQKPIEFSVRKRREHLKKSRTESCDLGRPIFTCEEWKAIVKRRSRSLSKSPEKFFSGTAHTYGKHFTCGHCGERSAPQQTVPSLSINRNIYPFPTLKSFSIDTTYHNQEDDEDIGIHTENYRSALWLYIRRKDELTVWDHKFNKKNQTKLNGGSPTKMVRSDSDESTQSERLFRRHYESVTHRMIHRRASIEMYKKAIDKSFAIEKEIVINRNNGEFGFRIHGSRPVVVSAIEKNTPAETCGLDVGDIVVTINGHNVLDSSHSDVVRIAHSGTDILRLEVVSTRNALNGDMCDQNESLNHDIVINGYLTKFKTNFNSKEKNVRKNRWFILKTDNCLYWYKSTKEMDPLGVICLQGYRAVVAPEVSAEQPFAFRLVKSGLSDKYFAAKDNETVGQWVSAINQRANKLNKTDPYIETVLNNITKSASSLLPNDCSGYLAIFSQRRKVWRNRYFILKDGSLYFYFDSNAKTSLGVFFLQGYRVQSCILIGKKNTFETIPPEPKYRHLWLMAESDIDKKRWLAALEYSIDRWIRI